MKERDLVEAVVKSIATNMGFYKQTKRGLPEPIARRLNNPCCLTSWHKPDGSEYPLESGYVSFPDPETGWRAARSQTRINLVKRRLTIREFFRGRPGVYRGFLRRGADDPDVFVKSTQQAVAYLIGACPSADSPLIDYAEVVHGR